VRAAAGSVLGRHGRCDVLVHAAAAFDRADLASVDLRGAWAHRHADGPAGPAALTGQTLCTDGGLILR
jgi:hypothetical protein